MKKQILAMLLLIVMLVTALPLYALPVSAANFIEMDFSGSNISWGGAYRPTKYMNATVSSDTEEDGSNFTSFNITSVSANKGVGSCIIMTDGENNLKDAAYLTVRYRFTMANADTRLFYPATDSKWYVLVILENGTTYGSDCEAVASANGLNTTGEWAYMNFDLSGIATDATIKELWLYPYPATLGLNSDGTYPARPSGQTSKTDGTVTGAQSAKIAFVAGDKIDIGSVYYSATAYKTDDTEEEPEVTACAVTVVADGQTLDTATLNSGEAYTLPEAPEKEGCTFKGWSDGANTYEAGTAVTITEDTAFTALYKLILETGTVIYQNSFTDDEDVADCTSDGGYVSSVYGRLYFEDWTTGSLWRRDVDLDNQTGLVTISFKLTPNLQRSYNILTVNDVPVLSSYFGQDTESWPYAEYMTMGIRFGA